ncbi:hypothetical protein HDU81_002678 [Chytriomyces hyalinus]|nr:hypothetical protein HDU81_002678 [Chytriomyces hyalinus]
MQLYKILALSVWALASQVRASESEDVEDVVPEEPALDSVSAPFTPTNIIAPFLEQFLPEASKRWISSEAKKIVDGIEDDELLRFRGLWNIEEPTVFPGFSGDRGLVVKTPASHHAISASFKEPIETDGKTFVAQYEVKLQNGLECGGAYMKLLTADSEFMPAQFSDKTPYTIMFGPDRCGTTNKVHFIFRHKNPKTGEIEEKHLSETPQAKFDKKSNVYTLVVRPDNSFEMLINDESVKKGSLLTDFVPPVNPPKMIDDPKDVKPADWVDTAKIPDPEAKKPADWDDEAPREIIDEDATMPEDWLVDEPQSIPDPESTKPDDWDDEEDGEFTAPTIDNPKCAEVSGCGPWTKPLKPNPAYKGKWKAPIIDNPAYKGVWAPKQIENPAYFEDKQPSNMGQIGAIGFELWTMQNGILFDNIYIGNSEKDAKAFRKETWAAKYKIESEKEKKHTPEAEKDEADMTMWQKVKSQAVKFRGRMYSFAFALAEDPMAALKEDPVAAGAVGLVVIYFATTFVTLLMSTYGIFFGGSKAGGSAPAAGGESKKDQ